MKIILVCDHKEIEGKVKFFDSKGKTNVNVSNVNVPILNGEMHFSLNIEY